MNCQRAREVFPELLDRRAATPKPADGGTTPAAQLEARAHLADCPECQREFAGLGQVAAALDTLPTPAPSPQLRRNFYAMLEEEKHSAAAVREAGARAPHGRRTTLWRWIWSPIAGAALLALGFGLGQRSTPAPVRTEPSAESVAMQGELKKLREDMQKMSTAVAYSLLQQQQGPANERLREVLAAAKAEQPSDKILDDLVLALTFDPSANVRLRAIEALYPHMEREMVRAGVLAALPREQNPLVQLELIDFVAAAQDESATPALEKIAGDQSANASVREAAKVALAQL